MRHDRSSSGLRLMICVALAAAMLVAVPTAPSAVADGNEAPGNPLAFRSISAGSAHTCAIVHNGTVKCWGNNAAGQLGLGDTANRGDSAGEMGDSLPSVNLGTGRTATAIAAGGVHTCALLDNGTVKCWGANGSGRLGLGDVLSRGDTAGEMGDALPAVDLGPGATATAITAGSAHTCARLSAGSVKCWGEADSGRLGLGDALDRGDTAGEMGNSLASVSLGSGRTAIAITAGNSHTCALLDNATVKCWGENGAGHLGIGGTLDRGNAAGQMGDTLPAVSLGAGRTATAVTAGSAHNCALLDNASVKCWGFNASGQLGLGDNLNRGDAAGEMGDTLPAVSLGTGRTALAVSTAGNGGACVRLDNAAVKCWGINTSGQLGIGDTANHGANAGQMGDTLPAVSLGTGRTAAVVTGGDQHSCAVLDNATVKCWGFNTSGQLGLGDNLNRGDAAGEMGDALPIVALGGSRTAAAVDAGANHGCALLDNGGVKCWGSNNGARLGLGDVADRGDVSGEMGDALPTVSLGTGRTATAVTSGTFHNCALMDNATVRCWGSNGVGQLGLGDTATRGDSPGDMGDALPAVSLGTGRTPVALAAGASHTCALLDDATVKCWGVNTDGQLGVGDQAPRGDAFGEMGNSLAAVDLGAGRTATAVSAGGGTTCAVLDNASVKCWGNNSSGQLGLGDTSDRGDAAGEMGDNLAAVSLGAGRTASAVSVGDAHTCARLDNGTTKCWGNDAGGRLGLGDTNNRGDVPGEMGDNLPAVSLGTGRTTLDVVAGPSHTCARLDTRRIKCWGDNLGGSLGLGDDTNRGDNPGEMGDSLPTVALGTGRTATAVTAGGGFNCARLDDGSVKCWGINGNGRLGQGTTTSRGDNAGEMGDALLVTDLGSGLAAGVSGTVTDAVSSAPVPDAFVILMRTSDFSIVTGTVADGSGTYDLAAVPGTYFLYLIDRNGAHTAGFSDPPSVNIPADTIADVDPTMVPTRGAVTGTITESGPNTAIPGSWAIALSNGGLPQTGVVANGSGVFTLPGLSPGGHFVTFVDPAGAHPTRFFPNSPNVPAATLVNVTGGGTTNADGSLPTQTVVGTGAALTGTVKEQGTSNALANVFVIALKAADFSIARGGLTNGSGAYSLDVVAGGYKIVYLDAAGLHNAEWHSNQPASNLGGAVTVTAPAVTNASLDRNTGSMSGTVRDDPSNLPIAGAWVLAIGPNGIAGGAITAANGTYAIANLPPGTYRAVFVDPTGGRTLEYFDNAADFAGADPFNITAATNTNEVDGFIAVP